MQPVAIVGFSSRVLSNILFPVNPSHLLLEGFKAAMIRYTRYSRVLHVQPCQHAPMTGR